MNKDKYQVQITKAAWLEAAYFLIRGILLTLIVGGVAYAIIYLGIIPKVI